jgi:dihydroxy-acid dehydratase
MNLEVDDATLAARRAKWVCPEPKYKVGVFGKYIRSVGSASEGAVTSGA